MSLSCRDRLPDDLGQRSARQQLTCTRCKCRQVDIRLGGNGERASRVLPNIPDTQRSTSTYCSRVLEWGSTWRTSALAEEQEPILGSVCVTCRMRWGRGPELAGPWSTSRLVQRSDSDDRANDRVETDLTLTLSNVPLLQLSDSLRTTCWDVTLLVGIPHLSRNDYQ